MTAGKCRHEMAHIKAIKQGRRKEGGWRYEKKRTVARLDARKRTKPGLLNVEIVKMYKDRRGRSNTYRNEDERFRKWGWSVSGRVMGS